MNKWKAFWATGLAALFGLSLWQNRRRYQQRSWWFVSIKSAVDTGLVSLLAMKMPAMLCGYVILWLSKPVKGKPMVRTTITTLLGVGISVAANRFMEAVVILGVLAMDLVSGGFARYWKGIGAETIDWKRELHLRRKAA